MTEKEINSNIITGESNRDIYANRIDALNKVSPITFIPGTKVLLAEQIAEYYHVPREVVKTLCSNHRLELIKAGAKIMPADTFNSIPCQRIRRKNTTIAFEFGCLRRPIQISVRGAYAYPAEAILRVGMLLRGSIVAYKVREELFKSEMEEDDIVSVKYDLCKVIIGENRMEVLSNILDYAKKANNEPVHKKYLNEKSRKAISLAIIKLYYWTGKEMMELYDELSDELESQCGISLKERGNESYIKYIYEDEWDDVVKALSSMAQKYKTTITKLLNSKSLVLQ